MMLAQQETEADQFREALHAFGVAMQPRDAMDFVDGVEQRMLEVYESVIPENRHTFTPGMYARTICMLAGEMYTSKIHLTQHQYIIQCGCVSVWTKEHGVVTLRAPYHGITTPGTRRILYIHTDCVWTTFHPNPTDETDLEKLEKLIIMKHTNPKLEGRPE